MIYLFTALYWEAQPFIRQLHMKKNLANTRFQEFYQEASDIRLFVTGVGGIAAAAGVGSLCTQYRPQEGDLLVNIGICAHTAGGTGAFLCNKIMEQETGKTFYPDILYRHSFREEAILSGMTPWNGERSLEGFGAGLYDMEAAAIYQAGSYFFGPHQMLFLKVVSDRGNAAEVTKDRVIDTMEAHQQEVFDFISGLKAVSQEYKGRECYFGQQALIKKLSSDFHCSKAMEDSLRQQVRYWELAGIDYQPALQDMYREGLLPCQDKRNGKFCFEEWKRRLLL